MRYDSLPTIKNSEAVALRISAQPCFRAKKLQPGFEKSGCSCKIKICDYQIFYKRIIQKIQMDIN